MNFFIDDFFTVRRDKICWEKSIKLASEIKKNIYLKLFCEGSSILKQIYIDFINFAEDCFFIYENADKKECSVFVCKLADMICELRDSIIMEIYRYFCGESDFKSFQIQVRSGSGGEDARDLVSTILKNYCCYFDLKNLKKRQFDNGIEFNDRIMFMKMVISETGIWKIIRLSPISNKRHTSFVSVNVFPTFVPQKVLLEKKDYRVETFRASGAGGQHVNKTNSAVRLTHFKSGIVTSSQNHRSQHQNKAEALELMAQKLEALTLCKQEDDFRRKFMESKDIDRTVSTSRMVTMYPFKQIKIYFLTRDENDKIEKSSSFSVDGEILDNMDILINYKIFNYILINR